MMSDRSSQHPHPATRGPACFDVGEAGREPVSIRFGDCRYDTGARELRRGGRVVELTPRAFDLLGILLEMRPRVVEKDKLRERLWPDAAVGDTSLAKLVSELRQATGDDPREPRFIRTVHRHGYAFFGEAVDEVGAGEGAPRPDPGPYPGLSAFTSAQAAVFFGREAEVAAVWQKLPRRRLLAVIGPSGAGKTSFLRAGVVPARPEGWAAVVCTPGASPFLQLGQALVPQLAGDPEALQGLLRFEDPDAVVRSVWRWRESHDHALLAVDQLEELFTQNPAEVQRRYTRLLGRLAAEADVHVLLLVRDDFLMRCHDHPALSPVFESLTPLGTLDGAALRRVLVEPARAQGYAFEDKGLTQAMVEAVAGERGGLPLLAFALARLWEERDRERRLMTRAAYEEIGGVAGALARQAEQTLERIGPQGQGLVREIFRSLVTAQGTRVACDRQELLSIFADRSAGEAVLRALIDARLVTSYELSGDGGAGARHRVEIVHESLLVEWPRLARWRAQDQEGGVLRDQLRQAAHLWEERGRPADLLWTGTSFRELALWRERYPGALTALEEDFAKAMVGRERRRTRLRRIAGVLTVAGSLAVAAAVGVSRQQAVRSAERAERQVRIAEASRLVALGRNHIDTYPTAALAFARRSLEVADNEEARRLAVEALWSGATARILPVPHDTWNAVFSPDGSQLAAVTFSENLLLASETGAARLLPGFTTPAGPGFVGFAPSGERLLTSVSGDDGVRVLSLPEGRSLGRLRPDSRDGVSTPVSGLWPRPEGLLFLTPSTRATLVRLGVRPYGGGSFVPIAAVSGPLRDFAVGPTRLAVVRAGRLSVRPLVGGADTPEQTRASIDADDFRGVVLGPWEEQIAIFGKSGQLRIEAASDEARALRRSFELEAPEPDCRPDFDHTGSFVAWASSARGLVSIWDLRGPPDARPRELRRPDTPFTKRVLFQPGGDWLAAANASTITFWAVGQPWVRVLPGHSSGVRRLRFTPESDRLVSCGFTDGVSVWPLDPSRGASRRRLGAASGQVDTLCYELALDPAGERALWGAAGATLSPLDGSAAGWLIPPPTSGVVPEVFHGAAFDPSGRRIATADNYSRPPGRKTLRLWDLDSGEVREWPQVPPGDDGDGWSGGVYEMAIMPDGDVLMAGHHGLRRFDPDTGGSRWVWRLPGDEYARFSLSADGTRLVGFRSTERYPPVGPAFELDPDGGEHYLASHGSRVSAIALDAAGDRLVTGDDEGAVRVGRLDGAEPHLLLGHSGVVVSVAISPDGRWIASASGTEIRLWPMPDLGRPPLHELPHEALLEKLRSFTNLEVVEDARAPTGYRLAIAPFPGWKDLPTW